MKQRTGFRIALIALPLGAFLVYAAVNWFELVEEPVRIGAKREAIEDPYLAYARLLERMGTPFKRFETPSGLDSLPSGGTLVLSGRRLAYMTPARVRRLLSWIEGGGHVVAEWEPSGIDDPLLDGLGIERKFDKQAGRPAMPRMTPQEFRDQDIVTFDWPHLGPAMRARAGVYFGELGLRTYRANAQQVLQGKRMIALTFPVARGRVTVLPSLRFLRNSAIAENDHAELGWRLASTSKPALLFVRLTSPGFMEWLTSDAWPALVAAALLLMLWLARIIPRFGPLEPDAPPIRRSLLEHIVASGRFLWSRGAAAELVEAVRERVNRAARRSGAPTQALAVRVPGAAATPMDAVAFTQRMASLQQTELGLHPKEKRKKKWRMR